MSDVTLSYKGSDILELSDSGSSTLKTGGKYCEADIELEYVKPSGGEWTTRGVLEKTEPSGHIIIDGYIPDATALQYNTGVTSLFLKNINLRGMREYGFRNMSNLLSVVAVNLTGYDFQYGFFYCTNLKYYDTSRANDFAKTKFSGCSSLDTIVLRNSTVISMTQSNSLQNTPFWTGKTGGTIYIPKVLYDELGTGSSLDYKSATNWSVYEGYGTITWAQIEGSQYETHYADGTVIPT